MSVSQEADKHVVAPPQRGDPPTLRKEGGANSYSSVHPEGVSRHRRTDTV